MTFKKSVLIFGNSLNLTGIGACLRLEEALDIVDIDPQDTNAKQRLEAMTPAVILFDLLNPPNDLDLALLRSKPRLLLIGVDPSSDEVLVLTGKRSKVFCAYELTQLILKHTEVNASANGS